MVAKKSLPAPLIALVIILVGGGTAVGILIPAMRRQGEVLPWALPERTAYDNS